MNSFDNFQKLDIKTKKIISNFWVWNFKSHFSWKWLEFEEFKEYCSWEDSRYIDWIASLKENKTLVKKYNVEKSVKVFFVLDLRKSMNFWTDKTKIDTLIEIFIFLALSSVENLNSVWWIMFDENNFKYFHPKKWKVQVFKIYSEISKFKNSYRPEKNSILKNIFHRQDSSLPSKNSLETIISYLTNTKLKNNILFILSDEMNLQNVPNFKILALKNDLTYINIFDNFENTLENNSLGVFWFVWENWKDLNINLSNKFLKKDYQNYRQEKIRALSDYLHKMWAYYLMIDNLSNIYKELFYFFKIK